MIVIFKIVSRFLVRYIYMDDFGVISWELDDVLELKAGDLFMRTVDLKTVVKKCTLYYTYLGVGIGVILFLACTFNHNIPVYINKEAYYGVVAGLIGLIFSPVIMAVVGLIHSVIIWYPILWIYRKISNRVKA